MTAIRLEAIDCVEGMDAMPPDSVDVIVTSPPYNLGIKYRKYNDNQRRDVYLEWTRRWLTSAYRVLDPGGSLFLNLGGCPRQPMMPHHVILLANEIFKLQNTFHWVKAISVKTRDENILSVGHFKPINSTRYVNDCHEPVFHLTKTGRVRLNRLALGVPYADKSNVKRWKHTGGRDKRCRGNVWFIPYETIVSRNKQRPHPATFPPKLAEYAIRLHMADMFDSPNDYVALDPFVGIGSAAVGAVAAGVKEFVGFDCDDEYIEEARRRCSIPTP